MASSVLRKVGLVVLGALACAPLAAQGPYRFFALTPCRVLDTRPALQPLVDDTTRNIAVRGVCGVPTEATAVALNVTIAGGGGSSPFRGHLRIWPSDAAMPNVSTINWEVSGLPIANGAIVPLDVSTANADDISAQYKNELGGVTPGNSVSLIIDVTGYFATPAP